MLLSTIFALLGILALFVVAWVARNRRAFKLMNARAQEAVDLEYAALDQAPVLRTSYVYSFPAFTLTFASGDLCQQAGRSGANDRFLRRVQEICQDKGTPERPFDAHVAVTFDYPGRMEEYMRGSLPPGR